MSYERGDVVWGPAPHKSGPAYRPWVLVSDSSIPFADEESIALGMTTRERASGIRVPDDAWVRGGSRETSHVSPWYVNTLKHRDLDRRQGRLDASLVSTAVEALHGYTPRQPSGTSTPIEDRTPGQTGTRLVSVSWQ